jgi:carbon-monoxide dehydrogenase large subunit
MTVGDEVSGAWIGRALPRFEDRRLLRGEGRYVADVAPPGRLDAAFVRSPHAHARIRRIDTAASRAAPGVVEVLTSQDLGGAAGPLPGHLWDAPPTRLAEVVRPHVKPAHQWLLARDRTLWAGQAVAIVVAESPGLAEDAAQLVDVEYEPMPAVVSAEAALAPGGPLVHEGWGDNVGVDIHVRKGDVEAALARAHHVVRERFTSPRLTGVPMETRAVVAQPDPLREGLTVWCSTQLAHSVREGICRMLGLADHQVRVIAPDVGGGFGIKGVLYPEELVIAAVALRVGRPVRWVEDRWEHFHASIHARDQVHDIELGVDRDGHVTAVRDSFLVDCGAFNSLGIVIPYNTIAHLCGAYRVPALEVRARGVATHKVPAAPYRGAGRPEAVFAMERALERAARALDMDPVELRLRNLVRPEEMPYDTGLLYRDGEPLVLDSGDHPAMLRRAAELAREDLEEERASAARRGRRVGLGVACYAEGTGIGPFEGARVEVALDGSVTVGVGSASQGQGHETAFVQVCLDHLQVRPESVRVVGGDSAAVTHGWGTVASRSAVAAGSAVARAAGRVRDKAIRAAAVLLEAAEEDLVMEDGRISVRGAPQRGLSLSEVARALRPGVRRPGNVEPGLEAVDYFEPPTVTWAGGAHAAVVEVDPETGEVALRRYVVVHDCGRMINPTIVEGQIHGGVAQGIGAALLEELVYDEDGRLLTASLMDYLLPTVAELPVLVVDHVERPSPLNPLGVKGLGEGGAIPPPAAIANAVEDALGGAVLIRRTPLSPAYLRELLAGAPAPR